MGAYGASWGLWRGVDIEGYQHIVIVEQLRVANPCQVLYFDDRSRRESSQQLICRVPTQCSFGPSIRPSAEQNTRQLFGSPGAQQRSFISSPPSITMISRALRTSRALPLRRNALVPRCQAKRTVTTDAASSHAEKENVPAVRVAGYGRIFDLGAHTTCTIRRMTSLSRSDSRMRASKHMSSTLPHIPSPPRRKSLSGCTMIWFR